jgi:hypothetical protein
LFGFIRYNSVFVFIIPDKIDFFKREVQEPEETAGDVEGSQGGLRGRIAGREEKNRRNQDVFRVQSRSHFVVMTKKWGRLTKSAAIRWDCGGILSFSTLAMWYNGGNGDTKVR